MDDLYYGSEGNPTKSSEGVEAKAARGTQLMEKQRKEEVKQPSCHSRWSQGEDGEVCVTLFVTSVFSCFGGCTSLSPAIFVMAWIPFC